MKRRCAINWVGALHALSACTVLLLTACGSSGSTPGSSMSGPATSSATPPSLTGVVHGGQSPIVGATVTLWAAGSPPVGNTPCQAGQTTTDANGKFAFTFVVGTNGLAIPCPEVYQLLYIVASGGNAGGGVNTAINLMAAVGSTQSYPPSIVINELTTVAAVYALNAFSKIASSGPSGTLSGCVDCVPTAQYDMTQLDGNPQVLGNAFKTAALLATVTTGQPANFLPSSADCAPGSAAAPLNCYPLETLTALANSLAACVNSSGPGSSQCTFLFQCAVAGAQEQSGNTCSVPSGATLAADTLQATLSIAQNPGLVSISGIFDVAAPAVVFSPGLTAVPNDWTIAVAFTGGGISSPGAIAIDGNGNVWTTNSSGVVAELNPIGQPVSPVGFAIPNEGESRPTSIAIDAYGNAWVPLLGSNGPTVTGLTPAGHVICTVSLGASGGDVAPEGIAIDATGALWVTNENFLSAAASNISLLQGNGQGNCPTFIGNFSGGGVLEPGAIAIDGSGNVWAVNSGATFDGYDVSELSPAGVAVSGASGFTASNSLNQPNALAIDPQGNVWIANQGGNSSAGGQSNGSVTELNPQGAVLSPAPGGFVGGGMSLPNSIGIDGAGNVWVANYLNSGLTELNSNGMPRSPSTGFTANGVIGLPLQGSSTGAVGIAIDGAGDVWTTNGLTSVVEYIGAAAPTVTPLVAQIATPSAALVSIAVTPASASVAVGATQQFTATATFADGATRNFTNVVNWISSNPSAATINASGLATGVAAGSTNITGGALSVTSTPPAALAVTALVGGLACYPNPTLAAGATAGYVYASQSYCVNFSGQTFGVGEVYTFTSGTLTYTTPAAPGALTQCQYATSGTVIIETGAPPGSGSTGPTPCTGTIQTNGSLNITDSSGQLFTAASTGYTCSPDASRGSGYYACSVTGNYNFTNFPVYGGYAAGTTLGQTPDYP
jgi:sugar lactone lactonase YvrE